VEPVKAKVESKSVPKSKVVDIKEEIVEVKISAIK